MIGYRRGSLPCSCRPAGSGSRRPCPCLAGAVVLGVAGRPRFRRGAAPAARHHARLRALSRAGAGRAAGAGPEPAEARRRAADADRSCSATCAASPRLAEQLKDDPRAADRADQPAARPACRRPCSPSAARSTNISATASWRSGTRRSTIPTTRAMRSPARLAMLDRLRRTSIARSRQERASPARSRCLLGRHRHQYRRLRRRQSWAPPAASTIRPWATRSISPRASRALEALRRAPRRRRRDGAGRGGRVRDDRARSHRGEGSPGCRARSSPSCRRGTSNRRALARLPRRDARGLSRPALGRGDAPPRGVPPDGARPCRLSRGHDGVHRPPSRRAARAGAGKASTRPRRSSARVVAA